MQKAFFIRFFGLVIILMLLGVIKTSASEFPQRYLLNVSVWGEDSFVAPPSWESKKRVRRKRTPERVPKVQAPRQTRQWNTQTRRAQPRQPRHVPKFRQRIAIHKCEDGVPQIVPRSIPRYIDTPEQKEIRVYIRDAYVGLYQDGILICLMPTVTGGRKTPTSVIAGLNVTQDQKVHYYSKKLYPGKRGRLTPAYMKYAIRVGRPDKPVGTSGFFLHTGNISSWHGKIIGRNPNPRVGSHGCIRLSEVHARFLYYWVQENTKVRVFVDYKKQHISQR